MIPYYGIEVGADMKGQSYALCSYTGFVIKVRTYVLAHIDIETHISSFGTYGRAGQEYLAII